MLVTVDTREGRETASVQLALLPFFSPNVAYSKQVVGSLPSDGLSTFSSATDILVLIALSLVRAWPRHGDLGGSEILRGPPS